MTNVKITDIVTDIRQKMFMSVYCDNIFIEIFKTELYNRLHIHHSYFTGMALSITIDRNKSMEIPGYAHDKVFYINIVAQALKQAYVNYYNTLNPAAEYGSVRLDCLDRLFTLLKEQHDVIYKMFDVKPLIDGQVIIAL